MVATRALLLSPLFISSEELHCSTVDYILSIIDKDCDLLLHTLNPDPAYTIFA
jgi:hypothetical protein